MRILMFMATKNIYVADGDLALFEEAASLAGGMSSAVVAGLRLYVAQQHKAKRRAEMRTIEIEVQDGPVVATKRFTGRELLRYELRDGLRVTTFRVYLTERGQLAVHTRNHPDWGRLSSPDENDPIWENPTTWSGDWWSTTERSLRVYPEIDAAVGELPDDVVEAIRRALTQPAIEDLDI